MNIKNLPTKESGAEIEGKLRKNSKGEFYEIRDSHNFIITEIKIEDPETVARHIALAIQEARDLGFEQGRTHIKRALGVI